MNKKTSGYPLLLAIFIFAVVVRMGAIVHRPIQYDDAFSILLSQHGLQQIITGTAADTMPPLYYFLLHFWMKISGQIWFCRLLSVLLNLASIGFLYVLVKRLWGTPVALTSALLASLSPLQLYHAHDIRMYPLVEAAELCYLMCFVLIWKEKNRHSLLRWTGLIVGGAAAMYSHNLAIFVLIVPDVFLALTRQWKSLLKLILAQSVIGLIAIPWLVKIPGQISKIQTAFWTSRPGALEVIQSIITVHTNLPLSGWMLSVGTILSLVVFIFTLFELAHHRDKSVETLFVVLTTFIPPLLLFIVSYIMRPIFVTRGFLACSMSYYALVAYAIHLNLSGGQKFYKFTDEDCSSSPQSKKSMPFIGWFLLTGILVCFALGLYEHYTFAEFPRSPVDKALSFIQTQFQPGDAIIHENKLSAFPGLVYEPNLPQTFLADEPGSANDTLASASQKAMAIFPAADLQSAIGNSSRIFFIVYQTSIDEYEQSPYHEHLLLKWLDQNYYFLEKKQFNDLWVFEYQE